VTDPTIRRLREIERLQWALEAKERERVARVAERQPPQQEYSRRLAAIESEWQMFRECCRSTTTANGTAARVREDNRGNQPAYSRGERTGDHCDRGGRWVRRRPRFVIYRAAQLVVMADDSTDDKRKTLLFLHGMEIPLKAERVVRLRGPRVCRVR
jgi:hypothetical protein